MDAAGSIFSTLRGGPFNESRIEIVVFEYLGRILSLARRGKGKGSSLIVEQEKRYFYFFARFVTRFRSIVNVDDFQRSWVKLATIQSILTLLDRCEYYLKIRISNK